MKLEFVVLLALVAVVACTNPLTDGKKNGKDCICQKDCSKLSCEENNCLCLIKSINVRINQKDNKYPKTWLTLYLIIMKIHCLCLKKCGNFCDQDEHLLCAQTVYDRSVCAVTKLIKKTIGNDKRLKLWLADIEKIGANCANHNCVPACVGKVGCNPLLNKNACPECIKKVILDLKGSIHKDDVKDFLHATLDALGSYRKDLDYCNHKKKDRKECIENAERVAKDQLANLTNILIRKIGKCTALNVVNSLNEQIVIC